MDFACRTIILLVVLSPLAGLARHFGSKTPYDLSYTDWGAVAKDAQLPASCQLIHLRLIARHGTRTYGEDDVELVSKAVSDIKKALSNATRTADNKRLTDEQIQSIISWKNQLPADKSLLDRGKAEHRFLANNYYNLIKISPVLASFRFESTNVTRARESGEAFRAEFVKLLGRANEQVVRVNDRLLYYHKSCPGYSTRIAKNASTKAEAKRAKSTKEAAAIVEKINREKLGFSGKGPLSWKDIFGIYELTAIELAAFNSSVFLPLFDNEDLAYLEFIDDVEQYWVKAYNDDHVTRDMSCVLTGDVFKTAKNAYEQFRLGNVSDSVFGFAHLETLLPVYAALGLFQDPQKGFLADASRYFYLSRKYDTSEIGKMASNIVFLFYDCPHVEEPHDKLVMVVVNGRAQSLPRACPYQIPCPFKTVQEAYPLVTGYPKTCTFSEVCSLKPRALEQASSATTVTMTHRRFYHQFFTLLLMIFTMFFC